MFDSFDKSNEEIYDQKIRISEVSSLQTLRYWEEEVKEIDLDDASNTIRVFCLRLPKNFKRVFFNHIYFQK